MTTLNEMTRCAGFLRDSGAEFRGGYWLLNGDVLGRDPVEAAYQLRQQRLRTAVDGIRDSRGLIRRPAVGYGAV